MRQSPLYAAWRSPVTSISASNWVAVHGENCSRKTKAFDSCNSKIIQNSHDPLWVPSRCCPSSSLQLELLSFVKRAWPPNELAFAIAPPRSTMVNWSSEVQQLCFLIGLHVWFWILVEWIKSSANYTIGCSLWSLVLSTRVQLSFIPICGRFLNAIFLYFV